ncbi:MAG: hypothetical protein IJW37_08915 [Lachnospiraceae bacterium]|nr:hypothetical protein [Lachnospiraceae bacterium]
MKRLSKLLCGFCIGILLFAASFPVKAAAANIEHPQLIIDSYEIASGRFERSAECTLRIHIKNIDDNVAAIAGSITFYSSYVYSVFGETNQANFGEIGPGESIYVDFNVNLDNIVSGPNPIEFEIGWQDEELAVYTNTVYISPVLLEKIGFDIVAVKMPDTIYGSKNTTVSVSYENTGTENLQNVYMILDGDIAQGMQVVELEDVSAKQTGMVDYSVELLNMGENRISISFQYEDRNGTEYSTEAVETLVTVTDKAYIVPVEQEMDMKALLEEYRIYVVCAAVAVLLCIPFLISRIKKGGKKK